jgi:hypothetical protein
MLLILLILLVGCGGVKQAPVEQVFVEQPQEVAIWDGTADTAWYNESQTEFSITTAEQLAGLAKLVNDGNDFKGKTIKLEKNIMLNDTANWQNWDSNPPVNNWVPIGIAIGHDGGYSAFLHITEPPPDKEYFVGNSFKGTFDGNNYIISGIYMHYFDSYQALQSLHNALPKHYVIRKESSYQGLFGYIESEGAIKNLGATASCIYGVEVIGGLVGHNKGSVSGSYFIGKVKGGIEQIGGLVGRNRGEIDKCYFVGDVVGYYNITGGLAGFNSSSGIISNSYSIGNVIGRAFVGGLVGLGCNISNSYYAGKVTGKDAVGGIIGFEHNETINNSYYDKQINEHINDSISANGDKEKNSGKTTTEMKQKETFKGWDFDSIWKIDEKVNSGYPHLRKI